MNKEKIIKGLHDIGGFIAGRVGFEQAKNFLHTIDEAVALLKEQGWTLIIEDDDGYLHHLPGNDGQYLMTDGKDIWIDNYIDGVDDGVRLDSGRDIREIKAWMDMPKLPMLNNEGRPVK